jgi:hypothetical protein
MGSGWKPALGWATWGGIVLCAAGGAARTPDGLRLGVPGAWLWVAVAVVLAALWRLAPPGAASRPDRGLAPPGAASRPDGGRDGGAPLVGLGIVPLLWLVLPGSLAAGALSGPPLFAAALAAILLVADGRMPPRALFVPAVFLLYLGNAVQAQRQVGPQGDEPHYLMVSDSLLRDGDLSLERDYEERRYEAFFDRGPLAPHFRQRGKNGEVFSLHAVGLSLLILPAYAIGGYPLVSLFMACLAALAAIAIRALCRAGVDEEAGDVVGWILAFCPPLLHYAGLVFTEVPAALVAAWALREGLRAGECGLRRAALVGMALAFLPWLNVRYAIVAGLVGLFWMAARPRLGAIVALVMPGLLSALALAAYHHALYGFYDPRRVYGKQREFAFDTLKEGLPGLLLDQEFGLLVYAPIFVLAVPGLWVLARKTSRLGAVAVALVAAVAITAGSWHMWRGGFNPPARFLVPIVPALALGVAAWLRGRVWMGAALLAGWSAFVGLTGALDPGLVHRDRDVTAPLYRARSGATEWTRLLPSYVLEEPDRQRLALLWTAVLIAAAVRTKPAGARSIAGGLLVMAFSAEAAGRLSDARAGGREAVHVLGRVAIDWPRLNVGRTQEARWTPKELAWGPVYEPHRHSRRVAVAERLELPPGAYSLQIVAESLAGDGGPAPAVVLIGPYGRPVGRAECTAQRTCDFDLPARMEISLILDGGTPFAVKEIRLFNLSRSGGSNLTEGR